VDTAVDINADMSQRVVIDTNTMEWQASPSPTVWRKRLHHSGAEESGPVTSVVRYDPGSSFSSHAHPDGEEIFVLDGVFSDEAGDYPAGTHILNPEGFSHSPYSKEGCVLLVKLRQYAGLDRPQRRSDTNALTFEPRGKSGISEMPLYAQDGYDGRTSLIRFAPGTEGPRHGHPWGEELFILDGTLEDEFGVYGPGTWIRSPIDSMHQPFTRDGCTFFLKTGSVR
jgi:anti-sigma factor ChrR (cupin superfamily)